MSQMRVFAQETIKSRFIQCVVHDGLKYFEDSIIVGITSLNIRPLCLILMQFFLQDKCMFNMCSLEKGENLFHLHLLSG